MGLEDALGSALERGVDDSVTPGGAIAVVAGNRIAAVIARGQTASAGDGGAPVSAKTIYDLASLTKPMVTWALAVREISRGALELDAPVRSIAGDVFTKWEGVTIRHLLGHSAGLPAHREYFRELRELGATSVRDELTRRVGSEPLQAAPGAAATYSDVGYIALGALLERVAGERLDARFDAEIAGPLGLDDTGFQPIGEVAEADPATVAPTERDPGRGGLVVGEVHDENAHVAGGVCGHAGLFGTAADVARFAVAVMSALRGEPSIFDADIVESLVTAPSAPGATWRHGWDTPSPPPARSHAGDAWPRDGFGHLGFTGTSLWLDPARGNAVALLTNRVYFGRDPGPIRALRRSVMDAAARALGVTSS
jgi:CubicO group peptidase (beta-lactamase class C family)